MHIECFNCNSIYKGLSLILIPPFIAKALLDLPTLACDKAFAATLDAIATYDKDQKPASPTAAAAPIPKPTIKTVEEEAESEEDDDTVILDLPPKKTAAATATPTTASNKMAPTASLKKKAATPSTCTRCAQLLKFLFITTYKQHHYKKLKDKILNGTLVRPTQELEHCQCLGSHQASSSRSKPTRTM
jgi:hypothetical protein